MWFTTFTHLYQITIGQVFRGRVTCPHKQIVKAGGSAAYSGRLLDVRVRHVFSLGLMSKLNSVM